MKLACASVLLLLLVSEWPARAQAPAPGGPGAASPGIGTPSGRGGQRTGARERTPAQTGTASLSGRVTTTEGSPVRRAQVQVTSAPAGAPLSAMTDNEGRYSFSGLPAGQYTVRASKGGFVAVAYGQRALNQSVPPIILGDGESLSGLNIVLPRGSAISGRVLDEFGDPVLQAQVQALRFQYQADGERRLVMAGAQAITDDLGQFRLYGLTPGEYVVNATTRNPFMAGPPGPLADRFQQIDQEEGYAPTYYPGTSNPAEAQSLTLGLGQDLTLQIQLVPSRLSRLAGVVVDSQGRLALAGTTVTLRPASNTAGGMTRSSNVNEEGAFTLPGIPSGDYFLEVRPRPPALRQGDKSQGADEFAIVPITVAGADISGIRVATGKGATLSGRVVFDGTPPPSGTRVRVVAQTVDPSRSPQFAIGNPSNDGVVGTDGSFQLDGLAAPVFLRITIDTPRNDPQRYMTRSVLVDGVDIADVPLDPTRRGSISGVTLVITDKLTDISGTVTDSRNTPLESTAVLIVPEPLPSGVSSTRFVRLLQSDANGKFSVRGMPAGRYSAVAVNGIDQGRQYDPDVIQRVRQLGKTFSVREGETVGIDLKVTTDF